MKNENENISFHLTEEQSEKYREWVESLPIAKFGVIGGGYSFIFTPTSLGDIVVVKREDGHEINLTDYNW
jgi:hypothetical protein